MKSTAQNKMAKAIKTARASGALDGVIESDFTREVNKQLIAGDLTLDEAIRAARARYGLTDAPE